MKVARYIYPTLEGSCSTPGCICKIRRASLQTIPPPTELFWCRFCRAFCSFHWYLLNRS